MTKTHCYLQQQSNFLSKRSYCPHDPASWPQIKDSLTPEKELRFDLSSETRCEVKKQFRNVNKSDSLYHHQVCCQIVKEISNFSLQ
jgi:hypothetical protein